MTGSLWAALSGTGFGVFQTYNRRAVQDMDIYVSTFIQLLVSAVLLFLITLLTSGLGFISSLTMMAVLYFSLAGALHFFAGWTFLNASQKTIGAARTTSLIGTTPIFSAFFAAIILAEFPTAIAITSILIITAGVYLVNFSKLRPEQAARPAVGSAEAGSTVALEGKAIGLHSLRFGLATAVCWSLSPIFIRFGLDELASPILGVTIGMIASVLGFTIILAIRGGGGNFASIGMDTLGYKLFAAVLVALATWSRWIALDLAPVAVVLALTLISVPIVNLLSPIFSGRNLENVTARTWMGSALIIGGSLILIFTH
jgi:drug/metabolite transporter (DMT)-like permease